MEEYAVLMTPQAEGQLREICRYISITAGEPEIARQMLALLEKEIASLSVFPARAALTEEEPWRRRGIRKLPVKSWLVYFLIREERREVYITAILSAHMDQRRQLRNMKIE